MIKNPNSCGSGTCNFCSLRRMGCELGLGDLERWKRKWRFLLLHLIRP